MKKSIIFILSVVLALGLVSCKKEKCRYYNDIMTYYDQAEEAWIQRYQQGYMDSIDLNNQLYKIERERANVQKQHKDCVTK